MERFCDTLLSSTKHYKHGLMHVKEHQPALICVYNCFLPSLGFAFLCHMRRSLWEQVSFTRLAFSVQVRRKRGPFVIINSLIAFLSQLVLWHWPETCWTSTRSRFLSSTRMSSVIFPSEICCSSTATTARRGLLWWDTQADSKFWTSGFRKQNWHINASNSDNQVMNYCIVCAPFEGDTGGGALQVRRSRV